MAPVAFNLKHIEAFLAVADLGTFRRAAARLNTTQPNISNRISQLEQRLGVRLMERDAGSVRLTPKGQSLLAPARAIMASADAFLAAVGDDTLFDGVMRLGVSELVAHTWLRPFLRDMKARFPGIDVDLTVDLSANLTKALFARDLDLVLQSGPFDQVARNTQPLGRAQYAWVAAPSLGVPSGPITAEDITRHAVLAHSRGTVPHRQLEGHFNEIGETVRLVSASNIGTCLQMAMDGLGVACLPEDMMAEPLSDGRLQRLDYGWRPDDLQFAARSVLDPLPAFVEAAVQIAARLYPPDDNVS